MDTQVARERLLELRRELQETIDGFTDGIEAGTTSDLPTGGRDFGDEGTHERFAAENEGLLEASRRRLDSVEDALKRLEAGTYGVSVVSGKPIPEERLEARPDAATLADEEL
ncbi:TraR/DksA family transcriptional regulator [Kineococcus indalonis]|uniref:TraR/DksA family transcriptional regulator n=1 Tax=Kineococcus indalonis TaxID=2696566 RepID=UPI001411DBEB|nr:molecular chaperone DnaK [Kineococcus indalonis]NAZ87302.1 molecular chaperone DnaK [Kineococcus indalonis]